MATAQGEGVLLVGHGTRDDVGAGEFLATAELVREALREHLVEACFLELRKPDLAAGFSRLVQRGARRVAVVPMLLLAAGHANRDIPAIVARLVGQGLRLHELRDLGRSLEEFYFNLTRAKPDAPTSGQPESPRDRGAASQAGNREEETP